MFLFECFLTVILSLIWAIFFISHRVLVHQMGIPVIIAGFWTRVIGISLLFTTIVLHRELREFIHPGKLLKFALLIGAGAFGINLCALIGFKFTDASSGAIIQKTDILFTLIASHFLLREKMYRSDWMGTLLMILGTVVLLWEKILHMAPSLIGDSLLLLSAVLLTANAFIIKMKLGPMSHRVIATYNSSVTLSGFAILLLAGMLWGDLESPAMVFRAWPSALMAILAGGSIAGLFLLYYRALARLPFWLVRVLLLFTPVWSVAIEYAFLDKKLLLHEIPGIMVILAGAALIVLSHDRRHRAESAAHEVREDLT
ncbi:MAG: DMT family transporter [Planctomycetota bacterium]